MLQFVLGRASSGKSNTIYSLVSKENIDNALIIVPEQFSFETEKNLLKRGIQGVSVLNFSRLVDVVNNTYGGTAGDTLSNFDKAIVMLRALNNVKNELVVYNKYYDSIDFANKLIDLNCELKDSDVSISKLESILTDINLSTTKAKLKDIITIFLEYDSIVQAEFLDPADDMQRLYDAVNKYEYFKDKTIFFDGFNGFSNAQLKIIKCAFRDASSVTISLCCDPDDFCERKISVFHNIYSIKDKLEALARTVNCYISEPILLKNSYFTNDDLSLFEKNIFNESSVYEHEINNVNLLHSNSSLEMIDNVLTVIHRLVRTEGYKYGDFVIVARDINKYDKYISSLNSKYNTPVYLDKRKSLKYSPIAKLVLSVVEAALTLKSDNIFEYLKSGLAIIEEDELLAIYDYVYLWKIDGDQWADEWDMSVKGLEPYLNDEDKEKCLDKLSSINLIRRKIIGPILTLKKKLSDYPTDNCETIYEFISNAKIKESLSKYIINLESTKNFKEAEYCTASYEAFIEVLSSLHKCSKNYSVKPKKFLEFLRHSIANKTVGSIPQMSDEVSCGSADRIRPARPKIAFVIGLNQYEFPASISDNDLLLNSDRQVLIDLGVDIVDKFLTYLHNENFLIYSTSCCASEKVFLCSCSNMGENLPSGFIASVKETFPNIKSLDLSNAEAKIETADNSFSILAELDQNSSNKRQYLYEYYLNTKYKDKLKYLNSSLELTDAKLNKEFALLNFNKDIHMSASRIDCFYKCKFNYFCKYVLYLKKKKPAEIDVLNRGTIVHYVLENAIKEHSKTLADMTKQQLNKIVDYYLHEYLELMEAIKLLEDNRFKFIFNKISLLTQKTLHRIADEFKYTDFEPTYCECSIGDDVEPLVINGKNKITITGFIDRVDIYKGESNYVRVVDYKSGNLKININNLLYGLNLQMLIYLYAFVKNDKNFNSMPAGVFYLPVNGGYNSENPNMRMSGILPSDPDIYSALDKSGNYIPNYAKDSGRKDNPQINIEDFNVIFSFLEDKIKEMETTILSGNFDASPIGTISGSACQYCDFKSICRIESVENIRKVDTTLNTNEVLEIMRGNCHEI